MSQYKWVNVSKATECLLCLPTCLKYNSGNPVCTAPRYFKLPNGPYEVRQMDFIQLFPYHGYKYVLVMVCIFSYPTAIFLAKILLEKVISTCGVPLELHNDQGTCFNRSVLFGQCYNTSTVLITLNPQG